MTTTSPTLTARFRQGLLLLVAVVPALADTTGAASGQSDAPTKVTFSALSACALTGTPSFSAYLGSTQVGAIPVGSCDCNATPQEVVITDPALLALVGQPMCTDVSVTLAGGSTYLSWVKAVVTRSTGIETVCLADPGGSGCQTPTVCQPGYTETAATWTPVMVDLDADGVNNCTDPDLDGDGVLNAGDTCPLIADPTNADSNGDGIGDVCVPAPGDPPAVVTVPWLGDRSQHHEVYPGGRIALQGVAVVGDSDSPAVLSHATWDPGDGSGPVAVDPANALALELFHTYQGTPGQQFTATLTVTDATGATGSDTFLVVIRDKTLDVEVNMAVDKGLWHLHKQIVRGQTGDVKIGQLPGGYGLPATASAVQAMAVSYHVATGDPRQNPYVHDVNRMLRWLETQLQAWPIGPKNAGNPDTNGNGIALSAIAGLPTNYVTGHVQTAFVASGEPNRLAVLGPTHVRGRTYRDLVQDMVDYAAWGQMDSSGGRSFPERGNWNYDHPPGHADNAVSGWVAGGLIAAERVWGLTVPNFVKTENNQSVRSMWNASGQFGYLDTIPVWSDGAGTTPGGVTQWILDGRRDSNAEMRQSLNWLAMYHRTRNNYRGPSAPSSEGNDFFVIYGTARAYRLQIGANGQPSPYSMVDDNPADGVPAWDWFRNDPPAGAPAAAGPIGAARAVIASQNEQGAFRPGGIVDLGPINQPWGILILSPSLFEPGPRAVCSATPAVTIGPVTFTATESFHPIDGRAIVNYDWTFEDGTAATGAEVVHTFAVPANLPAKRAATLTVRDDCGNTHTTSCVVTLDNSNTPPSATDNSYTAAEDTAVMSNVLTDGAPDADADDDALSASVITLPVRGAVALATDGVFTYTPFADVHGADSFVYQVSDGRGGSATATVSLTIAPVNDAPVAVDNTYSAGEDATVSGSVLVDGTPDTDVDGDTLTTAVVAPPSHGALVLNLDGTFTYTPVANFHGADSFTYQVTDGAGGSDAALVSLTITPGNDAPVATNDAYSTSEDSPATGNVLTGVMPDTDADGDTLTAAVATPPSNGSLTLAGDGTFTYTPASDFHGADSFTYEVTDGAGGSATAIVSLTVTSINDAPVATANGYTTPEDTAITGNAATDGTADSDADSDALTASVVTGPAHGTLALAAGGGFTYTPGADFHGADSFTYQVTDGQGGSDTAVVSLTVTAVNDAPTLDPIANTSVVSGLAARIVLTGVTPGPANESSETVSVAAVSSVPAVTGDVSHVSGGLQFTPPGRTSSATAVVTVTATDNAGGTVTRAFTVTVLPSANTLPGANVLVAAIGPLPTSPVSVTFSGVTAAGQTTYTVQQNVLGPPDGFRFGAPPITFDISTTATVTAPLRVCIDYGAVAGYVNHGLLRLFHHENGRWVDRTVSVDTVAKRVCASVTSLSPFALAEPIPIAGRMHGDGGMEAGGKDYRFEFSIDERRLGSERGRLELTIVTPKSGKKKDSRDRFESREIRAIEFWNDPAFQPGRQRRHRPAADSAVFAGTGKWNDQRGYTFVARATDQGEPGRRRDRFTITIRNAEGVVVATVDATIDHGNIESERLRPEHWR